VANVYLVYSEQCNPEIGYDILYSPYTVLPVISLGQDCIVGQYIAQSEDWPAPLSLLQEVEAMQGHQTKARSQHGAVEVRLNRALEEVERYKTELTAARARSEVGVAS
jgi:hypothetical protein